MKYTRIDEVYIEVKIQLYDYDKGCGCDGRTDDDTYKTVVKKYLLKDFYSQYAKEMDADGNILIEVVCLLDHNNNHHRCGFIIKDTCHDPQKTPTDDRIRFAFKVNI